jgi:hypothetical protein
LTLGHEWWYYKKGIRRVVYAANVICRQGGMYRKNMILMVVLGHYISYEWWYKSRNGGTSYEWWYKSRFCVCGMYI